MLNRWERWRERRAMRSFRSNAAALGFDLNAMSDEEILEGVKRAARILAMTGTTVAELSNVCGRLSLLTGSLTHALGISSSAGTRASNPARDADSSPRA